MAVTTLATLALQASAQNQMRTWTLPPNRLNFAPTSSSVALPLASAGQYRVANGAYDTNGNLLFYVKDLNVYKADGTSMGALTGYTYSNPNAVGCGGNPITANVQFKEIAIVPVPNSCSKYYVIWTGTSLCNAQQAYAHYATVDVAVNTVTNLASTSNLGGAFSVSAAIAVSKVKADGFRKLYVQGGDKIVTFTIGANAITQVVTTTLANYSTSAVAPATSELELSPDGTQLAWGDYNNPVGYRIQGIPTTGILAATYDMNNNNKFLITTSGWVSGTEFDASGNVYYNLNSYTINTHNGIWKLLSTSITPSSFISTGANTTSSFNSSQLELGYDGLLYAVNNSNKMVAINTTTSAYSVVNSGISVQSNGTNTVATFSHYSLPDQIDGESYANFKGKPDLLAPSIGFTSFGADRRTGTYGDYDGSNCDMVMQEYAVGVYDAYKLTIYASDANSTQGTQIYTSNLVNGTFPATELTSLANNYIRINKGYYLVKLEVSNGGCNAANTQTFLINVSQWFVYNSLGVKNTADVTAANGNFKVFNCNAITLAPAKYKQTQYKLSLQSATSTGQVITGGAPGTTLSLLPTTFTTGLYPTTADLRTWAGTSNFIQNMTNGYILATLELKDDCNQSITKTALIWVNSLGLGSADYMINYGNGTSIDPDLTTLAAPAQVGQLGLGVNANSSTGFIDAYTMKIEKMNQSNGTVIQTVCNNPAGTAVPNSNAANIPQIGLNSYTYSKCGQASAYFMQPANQNQVYKLSFTVSNVCGTSAAKVGYFLNSDPNARMGDAGETANANVVETIASQGHAMYPNPSTGKAVLHYFLESESNVSLSIADVQGNKIATVLENAARSAGTYSQAIDLTNYPDGIYYYRLNTDKTVVGKIVKTNK